MRRLRCAAPPRKDGSRSAGQTVRRARSEVPAQVRRRRSPVRIGYGEILPTRSRERLTSIAGSPVARTAQDRRRVYYRRQAART
jgi:hypothetical protein